MAQPYPDGANAALTAAEKKQLLALARSVIESHINGAQPSVFIPKQAALLEKRGAFVTLHRHGRLRGCIGTLQSQNPLYQTICDVAMSSAFHDPRFEPVTADELSTLAIEISVLTPLHELGSINDIAIGTHGLLLKKGPHSGLLLPQVAVEQGWSRDEFLDHTCLKAGLPPGSWKDPDAKLYIFSAVIFNDSPDRPA